MRATRARHRAVRAGAVLALVAGFVASLAGGAVASSAVSRVATPPTGVASASEIDAFVQKQRAELKLSGLAVVVLSQGSVVFDGAYGDAAPGGPAVTLDTPFVLGSTSKQLTGLAIQQLISQGKLSLDDTVGMLLPKFGGATSPFADVTVAQLLSHTSGMSTDVGTRDVFDPTPPVTTLGPETRRLLQTAPSSKPGSRFEYSNGNYELLGSIVEAVTGQGFDDALQTLVAQPLGLDSTTGDLVVAQKNGLAVGHYTWLGAIDSTTPGPRWPMGAPSAYTSSTAHDLTRLLQAELGGSSGIDSAVFEAAQTPLAKVDNFYHYASGWYVRSFWDLHDQDKNFDDPKLPKIYEHDGDTSRETSYLGFVPDLGLGVVVLSNTGLGTDTNRFSAFTTGLLHTIVGTTARPVEIDPLVSAAPVIMVALPLAQLVALLLLILGRGRGGRLGRWIPRAVAALVTIVTLLVAFVVVPGQTHHPLLDRVWWAGVPDLATSVGLSLLLLLACVGVGIAIVVRGVRSRRRA